MKTALVSLVLVLISAPSLPGQTTRPDRAPLEILVLGRVAGLGSVVGAQAEYAGLEHVAPWVSARYGIQGACAVPRGVECVTRGWTAMAGVRLSVGPWGSVEPYLTLGVGRLRWDDGDSEATGTANLGAVWLGFGRIRPRVELGYEGHGAGVAVALGLIL